MMRYGLGRGNPTARMIRSACALRKDRQPEITFAFV